MRILAATYCLPKPDLNAGDRRFFELLRILTKKHRVELWTWKPEPSMSVDQAARYRQQFESLGVKLHLYPKRLWLLLATKRFDVGLFEFYWVAEACLPAFQALQPSAKTVIDSVDIHFARERTAAEVGVGDLARAERTRQAEMATYRQVDTVIAVSDYDREVILAEDRHIHSIVVRIIMRALAEIPVRTSKELFFVGTFSWPPNLDGIKWFVSDIWPAIRRKVPEATVTIVGSNPTEEIRRLGESPGVNVVGYAPDTMPYLQRACISIAPLRYGGGMKGKVVEAMAAGLPVVTTHVGAQGLNAVSGKHLLIADQPQEYAQAVVRLLCDESERARISAAGQAHIAELCSPEAAEEALESYLTEMGGRQQASWEPLRRAVGAVGYVAQGVTRRITRRWG